MVASFIGSTTKRPRKEIVALLLLLFVIGLSLSNLHTSWNVVPSEDFTTTSLNSDANAPDESAVVKPEFPYPLSCPQPPPILSWNNSTYKVALVYHVGMMNNWKTIVADQLTTLSKCGLGQMSSSFTVTFSKANTTTTREAHAELREMLDQYTFSKNAELIHSTRMPWESKAMKAVSRRCALSSSSSKSSSSNSSSRPVTLVFYFHTKGASVFSDDWRSYFHENFSYAHSLYWRKFMEYFTLERPHVCAQKIIEGGANACGVLFQSGGFWHYSGNFWVASCDYINTIRPINLTFCREKDIEYFCGEMWIGGGVQDDEDDPAKFVDLKTFGDEKNLYEELILPEAYANSSL